MKRMVVACALAALAGCATVEMSSVGKMDRGERLLVIQSNGYELLWFIPIGSGKLTWNAQKNDVDASFAPFQNNADTRHLYEMARRIAERENCDLVGVTFIDNFSALDPSAFYGAVKCFDTAISAVLRPRK